MDATCRLSSPDYSPSANWQPSPVPTMPRKSWNGNVHVATQLKNVHRKFVTIAVCEAGQCWWGMDVMAQSTNIYLGFLFFSINTCLHFESSFIDDSVMRASSCHVSLCYTSSTRLLECFACKVFIFTPRQHIRCLNDFQFPSISVVWPASSDVLHRSFLCVLETEKCIMFLLSMPLPINIMFSFCSCAYMFLTPVEMCAYV